MRFFNFLLEEEDKSQYIDERNKLFRELASEQRGIPEQLMLKIQWHYGGGPLNVVVEHCGDLIHRMSKDAEYNYWGRDTVHEKTQKCLYRFEHPYGFERETEEIINKTSEYRNEDTEKFRSKLYSLLKQYGDAHAKLPVYNKQQWLARKTCIAIGNRDWKTAIFCLKRLDANVKSESWNKLAAEFTVKNGKIVEFKL